MKKRHAPPADIQWFEDTHPKIDSIRGADEWILNDIYNQIGYQFKGYKTDSPYLAYALVYQLTRRQTFDNFPFSIYADEDYGTNKVVYRVWLSECWFMIDVFKHRNEGEYVNESRL